MTYNHSRKWLPRCTRGVLALVVASAVFFPAVGAAADESFNVQVSPSPLVVTLKPGERKTTTITVRNLSAHTETLYPSLKGFDIHNKTQAVSIKESVPANLREWVVFKQSSLTIPAGGTHPLDIIYNTPKDVGFSYSLAAVIGRSPAAASAGSVRLQGAVAVFNLINIDRPDAVSSMHIQSLTSNRSMYEFLPANFEVTVKNDGNVIGQPSGTLFIQRSFDDDEPLATLELNKAEGYILPGKSRTFTIAWNSGFPRYESKQRVANAEAKPTLTWNWQNVSQLRFGRYTAKAVLVYNDGQRDVATTASKTFWVVPWRLIGGAILLLGLVIMGLAASGWLGFKAAKKVKHGVRRNAR